MIRLLFAVMFIAATPLSGQVLRGRVLSATSGEPVVGAEIAAADSVGSRLTASSDSAGRFVIRLVRSGSYRVSTAHIAFRAPSVSTLTVGHDEDVVVEITMAEATLQLRPLVVVARRRSSVSPLGGYYERLDRYSKLGIGRFITREDIDRSPRGRITDYLVDIPFVQVQHGRGFTRTPVLQRRGSQCMPKLYVDGLPILTEDLDDLVGVEDLEGLEVYRGITEIPGEYWDRDGCGVILAWRRGLEPGEKGLTFKRLLLLSGVTALITLGIVLR